MNHARSPHPAPDVLRAFALGELSSDRCAELEPHVRDCPECGRALARVPDDTLLGKLRDTTTPPAGLADTVNSAGDDGLFYGNASQLWEQIIAVAAVVAFAAAATFVILKVIDAVIGLRVPEREEVLGLDTTQHGELAYQL